ncbi:MULTISPECIES: glutaminyl-peptide cyclotransferase [Flavobacteriaceae]|uniref:glutaminyl-peptide cyclotransferase n=1 Tax=Flavobacteriaceae TaxID=49546 RepID=UPI001FE9D197|nr:MULTISPECIES: glutaminyl-peptide cyclotransferase [Allomuricauda]MDC6364925.1 glutaminyl-peptide cyclotransferase [Muricauda sp. AC10]
MKHILKTMVKLLSIFCFLLFFLGCGGEKDPSKLFSIELEGNKNKLTQNQEIGVAIKSKAAIEISEVRYFMDGEELSLTNGKLKLNAKTLGNKTLMALISFEEQTVEIQRKIRLLSANPPAIYTYEILNTYPHDPSAYTQGLEFHDNVLYESTGKKGASTIRKVNFETGEILQKIDLDASVFGEGITLLQNKLYQLTWQSGIGYVYNPSNLEHIKDFTYGESREGWGLCNDGEKIYKSDGTEKIWFLNPNTLEEQGYIETVTNKSIFNKANELEYVNGKIYANVYQRESMMIIDATSGAIEGVINFGGLKNQVKKGPEWDDTNSVLNGVAYHKDKGTFFVTGKNWDKLFEVKILKKD